MPRRTFVPIAIVCAVGVIPAGASAQSAAASTSDAPPAQAAGSSSDPKDEALSRFKRGLELYQEADYNAASIEFRKAYELAPNYRILYNLGQVCYQLTDYVCALRNFERYLKDGGNSIASDRRAQVTKDVERLQARVGRVEIVTNVAGVDVSIDDVYIGKTPLPESVVVSAGKRRITVTKEGHLPITRIIEVAGTDSMRLELALVRLGGGDRAAAEAPKTAPKWNTISWIGVGVSGAFAVGAGVTGALALSASSSLKNARYVGTTPSSEADSASKRTQTFSIASDVLTGAAVVTLAGTLIWTFVRPSKIEASTPPRVSLGVSPTGLSVSGGF